MMLMGQHHYLNLKVVWLIWQFLWKPLCPSRTYTWYKIDPNRTNCAVLNWWCVPLKAVKQTIRSPSEHRKLPNSAAGHLQMTFTVSHIFCSGLITSQAMWLAWSVRHGPHMPKTKQRHADVMTARSDGSTSRRLVFINGIFRDPQ